MFRARFGIIVALGIAIIACVYRAVPAWSQSASLPPLVEGAKKEGRLVWYTAMSSRDAKPILDAFVKTYPFVEAEFVDITSPRLIQRVNVEALAGEGLFDVAAANNLVAIADKLLPYFSPEANGIPKDFKDAKGRWTGYDHNYYVLAYNTNMVSQADVPRRYEDLLQPKWKGNILMDEGDYVWYGALVAAWGKEKADVFMKRLAAQDIQWRRGHTLLLQLVAAGEAPLGIPYANSTERFKTQGAPVDWVDTLKPIVTGLNYIGISAKSKNPNTAKLFVDFILSQHGQEIIRDRGRLPARSSVQPLSPKAHSARLTLQRISEEVYLKTSYYDNEFRRIFKLQR
ncbi:MAG: ABC transporter substrate-binding protein [Alphaproteobacteria bacterium]